MIVVAESAEDEVKMSDSPLAVVTGASSGIGACYAEQLARRGYDLMIVARRRERLEQLAQKLRDEVSVQVAVNLVDLSEQSSVLEFADQLSETKRVDMLVNSAGFGTYGAFAKVDAARIAQEINVDMFALMMLTRAVLPGMLARAKGAIVNVSSVGGYNCAPYFATYSGIKSGVITFTESLYGELKGTGVRAQVACPGPVPTEFNEVSGVNETPVPDFMIQSAEKFVSGALRDLDKGKPVSIPHAPCRWIFSIIPRLPVRLRLAMASAMVPEFPN